MKRTSSSECLESGIVPANASPNTVLASTNETPCFRRLRTSFSGSHSNLTSEVYRQIGVEVQTRTSTPANGLRRPFVCLSAIRESSFGARLSLELGVHRNDADPEPAARLGRAPSA